MTVGILSFAGSTTSINPSPLLSKRSGVNMFYSSALDYALIDHVPQTGFAVTPTVAPWDVYNWLLYIDSTGYPDPTAQVDATARAAIRAAGGFTGQINVPNSAAYTGKYVLTWQGDGRIKFRINTALTFTVDAASSSNYTENANGDYSNTAGLTPRVVVTLTNIAANNGEQQLVWDCKATDPNSTGAYLRKFQMYRLADEPRLQAGKFFRVPFLQNYVDYNPGFIRFMNWIGGNGDKNCRWEHRSKPNLGGWSGPVYWAASPAYQMGSNAGGADYVNGTGTRNQYTLPAAVTTLYNSKTTPAFMQHGEVVTCRVNSTPLHISPYNGGNGTGSSVSAIAQSVAGTVTCSVAHGFANGDTIIHLIPAANGMQQLNMVPVVISNVTATTYDTINTSTFTAFTGSVAVCGVQYISMKVGSGNDRIGYPVMYTDGASQSAVFGGGNLVAGSTYTFYFDKNVVGSWTTAGVKNFGAWMIGNAAHDGGVPIEIITQFIIEVNELSQAQAITNPIHMFLNLPHRGLSPTDQDYSMASAWGRNALDVVLNGSTVGGVTYRGIKAINGPSVLVEYSNETWNIPQDQQVFLQTYGLNKFGGADNSTMHAWKSTDNMRDIKAAFPGETRIKYVMAGQGAIGWDVTTLNGLRTVGTSAYLADATVVAQGWGTPISNHDAFCHATYTDASSGGGTSYYELTTAGHFLDDMAKYWGADNSGTLSLTGSAASGSTTFTTTAANATPVVGQILVGTNISNANNGTFITTVSGSGAVWTITLSQATAGIISGGVLHSPSNGGGNYIGAQNQAAALASYAAAIKSYTGFSNTDNNPTDEFCNPASPTSGTDNTFAAAMSSRGKVSIQYEGGPQPNPYPGNTSHVTQSYTAFVTALYQSSAMGTVQKNYFDAFTGLAGTALPTIYLSMRDFNFSGLDDSRWAYSTPDSYGTTTTEGNGLRLNPLWATLSARNKALTT